MKNARSHGFTLVELLIVVVVIGILATIAIPKFSRMREKPYIAAVTSDLKNLASQQEIYLSNQYSYAAALTDMPEYRASDNVVISINEATGTGWAATGTHSGLAGAQCGIYFGSGSASNATPATSPGTVVCN
ncbi:MAG: prepilin-type N-terminal cleavage/methylation domain-containing protein [Gemmatimonadetes bacterium]|nr:prepilin-type N-terminal cleavage/methylation domain-containing protein [Gemmatimonadota bacterium]